MAGNIKGWNYKGYDLLDEDEDDVDSENTDTTSQNTAILQMEEESVFASVELLKKYIQENTYSLLEKEAMRKQKEQSQMHRGKSQGMIMQY